MTDDHLYASRERFDFVAADAKRHFGEWDQCDPVAWAIIRVVQAQNDLAHATCLHGDGVTDSWQGIEAAIKERVEAITALQEAVRKQPSPYDGE